MYTVYEQLDKDVIVLQLRDGGGGAVEGFDFKISISKAKDVKALRSMLKRERDRRNRQIQKGSGGP